VVKTTPAAFSWPGCEEGCQAREYSSGKIAFKRGVVVDVCDREGARIFGKGRLAVWLRNSSPHVAGNQQLIRAKGTDPGSS
jgi:hypothetical protein